MIDGRSGQKGKSAIKALGVAAVLTVFTSSQIVLTTLSKVGGTYEYDYATVPFLAETIKMCICIFLLWQQSQSGQPPKVSLYWQSVRLYPIPSAIYLVLNNVHFAALARLDPSTYQILSNLKIVTTGILFRLFLQRRLTRVKWMALLLLTMGTTISQLRGQIGGWQDLTLTGSTSGILGGAGALPLSLEGYGLALLGCLLSASAGVYTEYLMKKDGDSIYWQNLQLYVFGVLFNGLRLTLDDVSKSWQKGPWWTRLARGYNAATWLVVANMAFTGLLISWIMKYADVLVKVYATSMAMLLTTVLSIFLFNFQPTVQMLVGIVICGVSLRLYFAPPEKFALFETNKNSRPINNNGLSILPSWKLKR